MIRQPAFRTMRLGYLGTIYTNPISGPAVEDLANRLVRFYKSVTDGSCVDLSLIRNYMFNFKARGAIATISSQGYYRELALIDELLRGKKSGTFVAPAGPVMFGKYGVKAQVTITEADNGLITIDWRKNSLIPSGGATKLHTLLIDRNQSRFGIIGQCRTAIATGIGRIDQVPGLRGTKPFTIASEIFASLARIEIEDRTQPENVVH